MKQPNDPIPVFFYSKILPAHQTWVKETNSWWEFSLLLLLNAIPVLWTFNRGEILTVLINSLQQIPIKKNTIT